MRPPLEIDSSLFGHRFIGLRNRPRAVSGGLYHRVDLSSTGRKIISPAPHWRIYICARVDEGFDAVQALPLDYSVDQRGMAVAVLRVYHGMGLDKNADTSCPSLHSGQHEGRHTILVGFVNIGPRFLIILLSSAGFSKEAARLRDAGLAGVSFLLFFSEGPAAPDLGATGSSGT